MYNNNNSNNEKAAKYADFTATYIFQPIPVKNLGPVNAPALVFISISGPENQLPFRRRQRGSVFNPGHLCDDPTFHQLCAFARLIQHQLPGPIAIPATFLTCF